MGQYINTALGWVASLNFAYTGTVLALAALLSILVCCGCYKRWPETGEVIGCLLAVGGASTGVKILALVAFLDDSKLGLLKDDRIALAVGGAATILFAFREAVERWRKSVGFP